MIDRTQAANALAAIERAKERSSILAGYAHTGDILIAWGVVWIVGDLADQFAPAIAGPLWFVGIAAAALFTMIRGRGDAHSGRAGLLALIAGIFIIVAGFLIGEVDARLCTALVSLVVAAIYAALGLWIGLRFTLLGGAILATILIGWFAFPAWLYLWLALGGGGAFIVSGLWFPTRMTTGHFDEIVHQGVRLQIMAALDGSAEPLDFSRLKAITRATDGNLGAHLATLEKAGYVAVAKQPDGRRIRTLVAISPVGREAFERHVVFLRGIIATADSADDAGPATR